MSATKGFSFNRTISAKMILIMLFSIYGAAVSAAPKKKSSLIQAFPPVSIIVGQNYSYIPSVKGKNKAKLTFTIANKPAWILFNAKTGGMSGKPSNADIGITKNIGIAGKDRKRRIKLPAFDLTVLPSGNIPAANGVPVNTTVGNSDGVIPSPTPINAAGTQPTAPVISDSPTTSPTVPEVA
jgi:large repetitive protein